LQKGSRKGASLSAGALLGDPGRGSFPEDLEGYGEEGSGDAHNSLWGPSWRAWRVYKGRLWRKASLSIEVLLGNLEGLVYWGL